MKLTDANIRFLSQEIPTDSLLLKTTEIQACLAALLLPAEIKTHGSNHPQGLVFSRQSDLYV